VSTFSGEDQFLVTAGGEFGFLTIPADNPQTPEKDGAHEGETLYFYINGVKQETTAVWSEGSLARADLGIPNTPLTVEIISPEEESAVSVNPITVEGQVNNSQAQVEITLNDALSFTPEVNLDGTFLKSNIDLEGGPNIIQAFAQDAARNTANTQIGVYLGWVLHLKDVPWYEKEQLHYSGAATCKMILDYLREEDQNSGKTQDELHDYGHSLNLDENDLLLEMDAKAVDAVLGHFDPYDTPGSWHDQTYGDGDPYTGYNFGIEVFDPAVNPQALNEYLRDIIHWIAYPVTIDAWRLDGELVAKPNSPAAVPIYGSYEHWIVVNGAVTTEDPIPYPHTDPWFTPDFTVYGFWLSDPAQGGIGGDIYVTVKEANSTYFLPLDTGDRYSGKYLQVAEPPEVESQAEIEIAPQEFNNSTLNLIRVAQDLENLNQIDQEDFTPLELITQKFKPHFYDSAKVVDLNKVNPFYSLDTDLTYLFENNPSLSSDVEGISWREIIDAQALTDSDFRKAVENSIAREFIKVERPDNNTSYYLIPFDKYAQGQFLTYAAIIVDAQTGSFKQASWISEPVTFVPIDKQKAEKLVQDFCQEDTQATNSQLIWQPQGLSSSPFLPYWEVIIDNQTFWVTQDSKVWEKEEEVSDEKDDF